MDYRSLGRTGVQVSRLGLGTSVLVRRSGRDEAMRIMRRALDSGVNLIDTANSYGNGEAERWIGELLRETGRRDRVVIATKLHGVMDANDPNGRGCHRRHVIQQCEGSLRRLGTDYIDLYQLHRPEPATPLDETLRAFDDLVRQGKVRYIGTSVFAAWQLVESLWISRELGLNRFVCEQSPLHLLDRRVEREVLPMLLTYGFGLITFSPSAGGMLSGRYRRDDPSAEKGRLTLEQWNDWYGNHFRPEAFDVAEKLAALAKEKGCTPMQLALAWASGRPGVSCTLTGNRTMEQLEENLASMSVTISEEEHKRIDAFAPPGRSVVPYHQGSWGPHPWRW